MLEEITEFIETNIYHSKVWDQASEKYRLKAINQAKRTLIRLLPQFYAEAVDVESLAEQTIWIMKIDDTFQRADMGATSISVDGMSIAITDKDRTLAPFILEKHNLPATGLVRRKVGRYQRVPGDSARLEWMRHC